MPRVVSILALFLVGWPVVLQGSSPDEGTHPLAPIARRSGTMHGGAGLIAGLERWPAPQHQIEEGFARDGWFYEIRRDPFGNGRNYSIRRDGPDENGSVGFYCRNDPQEGERPGLGVAVFLTGLPASLEGNAEALFRVDEGEVRRVQGEVPGSPPGMDWRYWTHRSGDLRGIFADAASGQWLHVRIVTAAGSYDRSFDLESGEAALTWLDSGCSEKFLDP